jgi:thioredoxin 1
MVGIGVRRAGAIALFAAISFAQPALARPSIYPEPEKAAADIAAAQQAASAEGKRVLVEFGGDWCGDCIVLDRIFHQPENEALLQQRYVLVHVNVGDHGIDRNGEVAERYGIPLKKGVPALAVLKGDGEVVYSQKNGEFESMRRMDPKSVNEFLDRWSR